MTRLACAFMGASLSYPASALAQSDDWRPLVFTNLGIPSSDNAAYAEVWSSELDANDNTYVRQGDLSYRARSSHAPALEGHFVVRSPEKVAVLTVLDSLSSCQTMRQDPLSHVTIRSCPVKLAIFGPGPTIVISGKTACFVEAASAGASVTAQTYASFDIVHRAFKVGTVVNHVPEAGCQTTLSLPPKTP